MAVVPASMPHLPAICPFIYARPYISHPVTQLTGSSRAVFTLQKFETCPRWGANLKPLDLTLTD